MIVSKKGIHIIRALYPEVDAKACLWCGHSLLPTGNQTTTRSWVGTYRPKFKSQPAGDARLCFDCALRCSALEGQPEMPWIFASDPLPGFFPRVFS